MRVVGDLGVSRVGELLTCRVLVDSPQMIVVVIVKEVLLLVIEQGRIIVLFLLQDRRNLRFTARVDAWVPAGSN